MTTTTMTTTTMTKTMTENRHLSCAARCAALALAASCVCAPAALADERARVARWDGTSWSAPLLLESNLAGDAKYPVCVSFEGTGGQALVAWIREGEQRLRMQRWDGSAWGLLTTSDVVGTGGVGLVAAPLDAEDGVVIGVRRSESSGSSAPYSNYAVYSKEGSVSVGGCTTTGLVDSSVSGVNLPDKINASDGSPDKSYSNNSTASLSPGTYGSLSVGNGVTLNLSAGQYVFKEFDSYKNNTKLVCDTSGGNVIVIIANGNFKAKNGFEIQRSGSGVVGFYVNNGNFETKNNADIEAACVAHNGDITMGTGTTVLGHLFAKSNISVSSGTLTVPSWDIPGTSSASVQHLHGLIVDAGLPGSVSDLTSEDWEEAHEQPMGVSHLATGGAKRIVQWQEVSPH